MTIIGLGVGLGFVPARPVSASVSTGMPIGLLLLLTKAS